MKVTLFVTCLVDQVRPEVGVATVRLLRRLGCEVAFPRAQTCCGQPFWNAGFRAEARAVARGLLDACEGAEAVVAPSGSCAGMVRHAFAGLFAGDPALEARARDLAARTHELSQFLVGVLGVEDVGATLAGRATYHPSCHATRICGVGAEPLRLLARVRGLELVPLERSEDCCGFGGSFSVDQPDVSAAIAAEKASRVVASGATCVVSTDVGCLLNLDGVLRRRGAPVRALHLAEVLESRA
jgi:L-lactate dehydrogenase complex protein LldE